MIRRITFKKICLTSLLLLVAFLLYNYPEGLDKHIDSEFNNKCNNIYLIDDNNLVAMTSIYTVNDELDKQIKDTIDNLTIGLKKDLPNNLKPVIPLNTKLLSFGVQDKLLKINFSKEFNSINEEQEEQMIEALTYSLTELNGIDKIMIFVENKQLTSLPNSKKILPLYLDRSFGINKIYNITKIKNAKMITTYYIDVDNHYYIPISKLINDDNDKVDIIIKQLKTTTFNNSNLSSKINNQLELMNYEILNDAISMNFNSLLLDSIYEGKLIEEVKYAISYSIHDTLGIKNFTFKVNDMDIDYFRLAN